MALQTTTSGFYEGLNVTKLEQLIMWELGQVSGIEVTFDAFPQWLIRSKLNDRQNKFVLHSECIKMFALIPAKEDYLQYKLPNNCMDGGVLAARYYETASSYNELDIVDDKYMNREFEGYLTGSSSIPQRIWMGDMYGNVPTIKVDPRSDTDGDEYDATSDTGVAIGSVQPASTTNVTGTATGGGGTTLTDTAVDFTDMGLVPGIYVRNVTDGSYAYILSIAVTTITFAATLTGGTANTFSAGDSYNILAGEYGVMTGWDSGGDKFIFGYDYGLVANITVPADNFMIDFIPYPLSFPDTGNPLQIPEIPKIYHMALVNGVVADLLGSFHEKTREFQRATAYEAKFQADLALAASKRMSRPFRNKPTTLSPMGQYGNMRR